MKKVLLAALFLSGIVSANAVELEEKRDCHEYACVIVGEFDDAYGDQLSLDDYEWLYDTYFDICAN